MKSSLIRFIEHYRDKQMRFTKLKELWDKKIDKRDFDDNEEEVFLWFQKVRKETLRKLGKVA